MTRLMEREDQDKILDYLNQKGLPFSRYRFIQDNKYGHMKRLGSGGGGSVYAIKSRLDDELAVKIIGFQEPLIVDPKVIKDCELEVQTQRDAGKKCREIVQIEDAQVLWLTMDADYNVLDVQESIPDQDQVEGGLCLFILMEKLQPVLTAREGVISRLRSLDEKEIVRFAVDVAKALQAAHTHPKKIIHRDVKPENIFWDEFTGVYKLGDFGIAKGTQYGESLTIGTGTGDYRAPEVRKGGVYDVRADIYSYGMTLYKLLDRNWGNQRSYGVDHKLPELSNGSEKLKQIVMKACSYKPEERYASMSEILEALEQLHSEVITDAWLLEEDSLDKKEVPLEEEPAVVELQLTEKYDASSQQKEVPEVVELKKVAEKGEADDEESEGIVLTQREKKEIFNNPKKEVPLKKTSKRNVFINKILVALGSVGLLALLISVIGLELIAPEKVFLDLTSWKFYVAFILSVVCNVLLIKIKYKDEEGSYFMPIFAPIGYAAQQAENEKSIYWLGTMAVWVITWGFNVVCFFTEGFNWFFLLLFLSAIIGSKGLLCVMNVATIISIPLTIFLDKLPIISDAVYWLVLLFFIIGLRSAIVLMNGVPLDQIKNNHLMRMNISSDIFIVAGLLLVGTIVWVLKSFTVIEVPVILNQLHLGRCGIIYLVFVAIDWILCAVYED